MRTPLSRPARRLARPRCGRARVAAAARSSATSGRSSSRYVGIYFDRAARPERPHRLHRPDLARPRRVHGDRRLHDRDPVSDAGPATLELLAQFSGDCATLDDPARRARRRASPASSSASRRCGSPASTSRWRRSRSPSRCRLGGAGGIDGVHRAAAAGSTSSASHAGRPADRSRRVDGASGSDASTFNDWLYYLCWTIAGRALRASRGCSCAAAPAGRCRAIRDSEIAAVSSGVSLRDATRRSRSASARSTRGVAGSLFAIATTFVNPDTFPITLSILLLVGVVVGGLGSLAGSSSGRSSSSTCRSWARRWTTSIPDVLPFLGDIDTDAPGRTGGRLRRRPDPAHARLPGRRRRDCPHR